MIQGFTQLSTRHGITKLFSSKVNLNKKHLLSYAPELWNYHKVQIDQTKTTIGIKFVYVKTIYRIKSVLNIFQSFIVNKVFVKDKELPLINDKIILLIKHKKKKKKKKKITGTKKVKIK